MHKKKAGKLQTGSTIPKQYWLAVNCKPKTVELQYFTLTDMLKHMRKRDTRLTRLALVNVYFCVASPSTELILK